MSDVFLFIAAAAVTAAYVCRVDALTWRNEPGLLLAHLLGGIPAAWVMKIGALETAGPVHYLTLAACIVLLAALFPGMRKPATPAGAPAPVDRQHLERVSGGAKPPEPLP